MSCVVGDISSLQSADRVEIFRHLAVDESGNVDGRILKSIVCENFDAFLGFCDKVFEEKDSIDELSCTINSNDQLEFGIQYKNK